MPIAQDSPSFSDIENHWAKDCLLAVAERRIINGYPDGTFRPDDRLTRAEFAVILPIVFPDAIAVRQPVAFSDVPIDHWAHAGIQQAYLHGWLSGYPDGAFQPDQPIARAQVISAFVQQAYANASFSGFVRYPDGGVPSGQAIARPPVFSVFGTAQSSQPSADPEQILKLYFDDADQIPEWAHWIVAAAVQQEIVVNYPNVRLFEPFRNAARGEIAAILCRVLRLHQVVPLVYATRSLGVYDLRGETTVAFSQWRGSARLMRDIQVLLANFRLYPVDRINGHYNSLTEQGLTAFCDFYGLSTMKTGVLDEKFGWSMTHADPIDYFLSPSQDRNAIYSEFLAKQAGYDRSKAPFFSRGAASSPYFNEISQFPDRLTAQLNGKTIVSLGDSVVLTGTDRRVYFHPFPAFGALPEIDSSGLAFLHSDIKEACVCIGSFTKGEMQARWLGRNALDNVELWSTTKIISLLKVVCQANAVQADVPVQDCLVRPVGRQNGYGFYNLAVDLVSYQRSIASSNAVAAALKQFFTPQDLETWLRNLTGNRYLKFQGRYGEPPLIQNPELWSQSTNAVLLKPAYSDHISTNTVSVCDMARLIAMLGWHNFLPPDARLPAARWSSLETVVRAMGMDTARYLDAAIDRLQVGSVVEAPVILSKVGFGRSNARSRTELCYVALVWLIDRRSARQRKPSVLRTFSIALRAAKALNNAGEETRQLDARIAAEVTEILRRILTQELA
jgi:hypothetical protein